MKKALCTALILAAAVVNPAFAANADDQDAESLIGRWKGVIRVDSTRLTEVELNLDRRNCFVWVPSESQDQNVVGFWKLEGKNLVLTRADKKHFATFEYTDPEHLAQMKNGGYVLCTKKGGTCWLGRK